MDDNFKFIGLPSNEPIHVNDKPKKQQNRNMMNMNFGGLDPSKLMMDPSKLLDIIPMDFLMKMLPPEIINSLKQEAAASGKSVEDIIKESVRIDIRDDDGGDMNDMLSEDMLSKLGASISDFYDNNDEDDEYDNSSYGIHKHELGDDKYLEPNTFGSIPCIKDENIYENFIEAYGADNTKYLTDNGIRNLILTELTEKLPIDEIESLELAEYTDTFILFYAKPKDEIKYGFFVSVIKQPDGDFALFVPEFYNTFKVLKDNSVALYDSIEDRVFFRPTMSGKSEFIPFSLSGLELSTLFQLAPQNKCLLTPHQFGTIKNVMAPVMNDSDYLKIGMITSNESPAAILLKKDAELPLDKTKFPLYLKFDHVISQSALAALAAKLFRVDFNESQLLDNCELKYNSSHELYIEIDLGNI